MNGKVYIILILLEEFKRCVRQDIKTHLDDRHLMKQAEKEISGRKQRLSSELRMINT